MRIAALVVAVVTAAALPACEAEVKEVTPRVDQPTPAAQAPAQQYEKIAPSKDYALKTCVMSGDPLDAMGRPVAIRYQGREVQFCCEACIDDFLKDPAPALAKLDAAKK